MTRRNVFILFVFLLLVLWAGPAKAGVQTVEQPPTPISTQAFHAETMGDYHSFSVGYCKVLVKLGNLGGSGFGQAQEFDPAAHHCASFQIRSWVLVAGIGLVDIPGRGRTCAIGPYATVDGCAQLSDGSLWQQRLWQSSIVSVTVLICAQYASVVCGEVTLDPFPAP